MRNTIEFWDNHHATAVQTFAKMADVARANEQHDSAEFLDTMAKSHENLRNVLKLTGNGTAYNELKRRVNDLSWKAFHALEC